MTTENIHVEPVDDYERYSDLLDIALGHSSSTELSSEDEAELGVIINLLDLIDLSWSAPESELDRIQSRFLRKLAERQPSHPWVVENTIRTLGELIDAFPEVSPLPADSYEALRSDTTPLGALQDKRNRIATIAQALKRAMVPQELTGKVVLWLNRLLAAIEPLPGSPQQGLLFTRKQGRNKNDL